jgi:hypothetical protein
VNALNRIKVGLSLVGILAFGAGVRLERSELRWTGLGLVVGAWVLRFARTGREVESTEESEPH